MSPPLLSIAPPAPVLPFPAVNVMSSNVTGTFAFTVTIRNELFPLIVMALPPSMVKPSMSVMLGRDAVSVIAPATLNEIVSAPVPAGQFVHVAASLFALMIASRIVHTPSALFVVSKSEFTVKAAA